MDVLAHLLGVTPGRGGEGRVLGDRLHVAAQSGIARGEDGGHVLGAQQPGQAEIFRSVLVELEGLGRDRAARGEHVRELRIGIEGREALAGHALDVRVKVVVIACRHPHDSVAR